MSRVILSKLNPDEIIHPDDSAVIKKMNRIPGFKRFLKKTIGNLHQDWANVTYTGNGYDITPESNPQVYGNTFPVSCMGLFYFLTLSRWR